MPTIEYCLCNVDRETRERLAATDAETVGKRCLQRCGDCYREALLVVDGTPRTGSDHADLLAGVDR